MLKKTIKFTDYNGNEHEQDYFFYLSKAELMEMHLSTNGGMEELVKKLMNTNDGAKLVEMFKDIILRSYGEKSVDGNSFVKKAPDGHRLSDDFMQTEAYSELFMELLDADKAAEFVKGILPQDLQNQVSASIPAPMNK